MRIPLTGRQLSNADPAGLRACVRVSLLYVTSRILRNCNVRIRGFT